MMNIAICICLWSIVIVNYLNNWRMYWWGLCKSMCQKWDSNPRPHSWTRNPTATAYRTRQRMSLESGALDRSAILTVESSGFILNLIPRTDILWLSACLWCLRNLVCQCEFHNTPINVVFERLNLSNVIHVQIALKRKVYRYQDECTDKNSEG